jgi:peptidoglycan/xylan/chitin deacetylase (PgdA/CDA1 family)
MSSLPPTYSDEMNPGPIGEENVLSLTFDDGPSEWTPLVLDLLAEHRAHATFFILGAGIAGGERTLERTLEEGHELGLHSWSHPHLTELSDLEIRDQMRRTQKAIECATGVVAHVWRPPYFKADKRVRRALADSGLVEAGCSIAPEDYHWPAERTAAFVIKRLRPGAIVDLHDGRPSHSGSAPERSATIEALELILEEMKWRDLRSVILSQLSTLEIDAAT